MDAWSKLAGAVKETIEAAIEEGRVQGRREEAKRLCACCWHPDYHHSDGDRLCYVKTPKGKRCWCTGMEAER